MANASPPEVDCKTAVALITKLFPFKRISIDSLKQLPSYSDRNIYFEGVRETIDGNRDQVEEPFVLKLLNVSLFTPEVIEDLNAVMVFLRGRGVPCTYPVATRSGSYTHFATRSDLLEVSSTTRIKSEERNIDFQSPVSSHAGNALTEARYPVQVVNYIPGEMMDNVEKMYFTPKLSYRLGNLVGRMDLTLQKFQHAAVGQRVLENWDLKHFQSVAKYIPHAGDERKREMANTIVGLYKAHILPLLPSMKKGVIHGDVNGLNIVLKKIEYEEEYDIVGLIDFGDCVHSCYLFEVAIMITYGMVEKENPVEFVAPMLRGYLDAFPLSKEELGCLYYAVLARLCQSGVNGEYQFTLEPWNTYLLTTPAEAWRLMDLLLTLSKDRVEEIWGIQHC